MSAPPAFTYMPAPHERAYYGVLFQAADVERSGSIGGGKAVEFFKRSKLPMEQLKHIWAASDQPPSNALDPRKFAVAIRLIQLEQNGLKPSGPDLAAVQANLRPVFIEGIPPPGNRPPAQSVDRSASVAAPATASQQDTPPRSGGGTMVPPPPQQQQLTVQDPYSLTPQEIMRYEQLFPEYAKDSEYVYGGEAVQLFSKSGLSQQQLAQIWNMVDNPVDNRLDKLEFAMAMHLIVCVSRKNLNLPPGLPVSLKQLKAQQQPPPQVPNGGGSQQPLTNGSQHQQVNDGLPASRAPPQQPQLEPGGNIPSPTRAVEVPSHNTNGTAVSSIGGFSGMPPPPLQQSSGFSISEAFEGLAGDTGSISSFGAATPIPNAVTTSSFERPEVETVPEDAPVEIAPTPAPKMKSSHPPPTTTRDLASSYDIGEARVELEKLRGALQKLQAENISLKAKLGTMTDEEKNVQKELSATIAEITKLSGELTTLRAQVLASKSRLLETTASLKAAKEKKGVVRDLITEATATKQAMDEAYEGIETANEAERSNPTPSQPPPQEDFFLWGDSAPPAAAPVSTGPTGQLSAGSSTVPPPSNDPAPTEQRSMVPVEQQPANHYQVPPQQQASQQFQPPPALDLQAPPTQMFAGAPQAYGFQGQPAPESTGSHNRNISSASGFGEVMGGTPDLNSVSGSQDASLPHTPSMKTLDDLQSKCREAEDVSRDAEETKRQLQAQMEELRRVADEAENKARALAEKPTKKKKLLGRRKVDPKEVEKLAADAREKKNALLQAQSAVNDAVALAAATKSEAERLRKEADDAQIQAATAASMQQQQQEQQQQQTKPPDPTPPPQQPNYGYPPASNGGGYPSMNAGAFPPPQQSGPPHQIHTNAPGQYNANVMGNGSGMAIPTPANEDPYSNPFG